MTKKRATFLTTTIALLLLPLGLFAQDGGWLGVGLNQVPAEEAAVMGFDGPVVSISRVFPLSPAEAAGLAVGDVVMSVGAQPVSLASELVAVVGSTPADTEVVVQLTRSGEVIERTVTLAARPDFQELTRRHLTGNPARPVHAVFAQGDDGAVDLSALDGQVVVIDFWQTTCGPCLASIPRLNGLQSQFADQGLRVIGITSEQGPEVAAAIERFGIEYAVALDQEEATEQEYFITAYPTLVLIDRHGTVQDVHIGTSDFDSLEPRIAALLSAE